MCATNHEGVIITQWYSMYLDAGLQEDQKNITAQDIEVSSYIIYIKSPFSLLMAITNLCISVKFAEFTF